MTRYYRLSDDLTIPERWHLGVAVLPDGNQPRFCRGLHFESSLVPVIPVSQQGRALDFSLTSFAVPVATPRLAHDIKRIASADVQLVGAHVVGHGDKVILNSVRIVRCLDEQNSEFLKWTVNDHRSDLAGQYRSITKLVLNTAAIPSDAAFFRIDGSFVVLVVRQDVKEAMEASGCLGASFEKLMMTTEVN